MQSFFGFPIGSGLPFWEEQPEQIARRDEKPMSGCLITLKTYVVHSTSDELFPFMTAGKFSSGNRDRP